jgi:hypothetical protein
VREAREIGAEILEQERKGIGEARRQAIAAASEKIGHNEFIV